MISGNAGTGVASRAFGTAKSAAFCTLIALCALASALAFAGPATAATSRPLLNTIKYPDQKIPMGITTDSAGNVYVNVRGNGGTAMYVEKFDSAGSPVNFSFSAPYIEGNKLLGRPSAGNEGEPPYYPMEFDVPNANGVAVDSSGGPNNGYVYVNVFLTDGGGVWAFKPSGEYAGLFNGFGGVGCQVVVNQTNGNIYANSLGEVRRYAPVANFNGTTADAVANIGEATCVMTVDSAGNLYRTPQGPSVPEYAEGPIFKYPASVFGPSPGPRTEIAPGQFSSIAYDGASGHLFAGDGSRIFEMTTSGEPVNVPFGSLDYSRGVTGAPGNRVYASSGISTAGGNVQVYGPPANLPLVTTDPATNVLQSAVTLNGKVDPDGSGPISKCEFQWGKDARYLSAPASCSQPLPINSPASVSVELSGLEKTTTYHYRLLTTSANGVQVGQDASFTTPDLVAEVVTGDAVPVTKESALLHGFYRGQNLDTEYSFEIGTSPGNYTEKFPASPAQLGKQTGTQEVPPVEATGLQGATEYFYRLAMSNELGTAYGAERSFLTPPSIDDLETGGVDGVTNESAELNGSFTADHLQVHYFFEWGPTVAYGNKTPLPPGNALPPGSGHVDVPPVLLENLQEGGIYHYRIVASNSAGATFGQDRVFKTAEPPQISNLAAKNVKATSADVTAEVNPNRSETKWFFEWGEDTDYGNIAPVEPGTIPYGSEPVPVEAHLEGLEVGTTYHFRLVAKNEFGERKTGDQAFGYYPPSCPNSQIRQETGAAHLPDCRGYELVSPSNANGTTIFPYNAPPTGYATHPSRIAYGGAYGEITGTGEPIIGVSDLYVATRTGTGWTTKYVGKNSRETSFMGGPPHGFVYGTTGYGPSNSFVGATSDLTLDNIVLYDLGYPGFYQAIEPASNAPFVFDSTSGQQSAHWPSGVAGVEGGERFVGWQAYSDELEHFAFSSNVAFLPGVESFDDEIVCCSPIQAEYEAGKCCPGPIYDNETETGQIKLASMREDGSRFMGVPIDVSGDGSHILMGETADWLIDLSRPLYMRVDGEETLDVADGAPVRFVEMTADGSTVYFTSKEQLTPDDSDTSNDLYVWEESDPDAVTRVSQGAGGTDGDRDNCELAWVKNCDVQVIDVKNPIGHGFGNGNPNGNETSDTPVASGAGDIYFVSPEQLDGARGSFGQANIYLYHDGDLRFVASAEPETCAEPGEFYNISPPPNCEAGKIKRMQVSPDGEYAAFISRSRLTPYDNQGQLEMYMYTRSESRLDCVSCNLNGTPPTAGTYGSQNGLFLTDDGRAFFSTENPLVPTDTNLANDVYEFVEGKPQLITTGIGESPPPGGFQGDQNGPGVISVSADGTDVYIGWFERLVTQDHNGQELKIYDARVNGGFPAEPPNTECAAADECHGPGSVEPALPKDRTSPQLGGNQKQKSAKKKKKKGKKHKKGKKRKKNKKGRRHAG